MRTIKFSKINDLSYEQHNHEIASIQNKIINNNSFSFYNPCNLNIFITNSCNNNCDFCINKITSKKNIENKNISDIDYLNKLESCLIKLSDLNLEATITGGEPTLLPARFVKTIELLNKYNIKCRTVSTDGKNLLSDYNGKPLLYYMKENGFTKNINVSRMSIYDDINNKILQGDNITNEDIERLTTYTYINDMDLRLSCNLIPGYVDNFSKMIEFVDFYFNLGLRCVMFRELEFIDNFVNINEIFDSINENPEFRYIKESKGMAYIIKEYYYRNMVVKCYDNIINIDKDIVYSLSFNNNDLRVGFTGPIIL